MALTKIPPGSPLSQAISESMTRIGKHLEPGAASPAGVSNAMKQMATQQMQMAPHRAAMGAPPPGAGAPSPPAPGAM